MRIDPPSALVDLLQPWARLYGDSAVVPTLVVFAHIAALLVAGGVAVTLDRATLRVFREATDIRRAHLAALAAAHRVVVPGIGVAMLSGALIAAADLETYLNSPIYWTKMGLVVLLLGNGYAMTRAEQRVSVSADAGDEAGWRKLRFAAIASLVLWFAVTFAGVALTKSA